MSLREIENERYRIRRKRNIREKLLRNMKKNYVFFGNEINSYHVRGRREREKYEDKRIMKQQEKPKRF